MQLGKIVDVCAHIVSELSEPNAGELD
jgi:hypothetical protein